MKRLIRNRKWIVLATLSMGTAMQLASCQDDVALFGLRWAFSSITLPINVFLRDALQTIL